MFLVVWRFRMFVWCGFILDLDYLDCWFIIVIWVDLLFGFGFVGLFWLNLSLGVLNLCLYFVGVFDFCLLLAFAFV